MKVQQEQEGPHPGFFSGNPWYGVLKADHHHPHSEFINHFQPEGKYTIGKPHHTKTKPPPSFAEIARSLWGDDSPCITINIPLGLTASQGLLVWTAMAIMISMQMWQDVVTGITYLDTVATSMSLVCFGATPMAVDHPMPTL